MTDRPAGTSAREHALSLVKEHGWFVFRLAVGHDPDACDGGTANCKTVRPLDQWRAASSNDPEVVAAWDWSGANAYGVDCGKSHLFVVDVDPGGEWSDEVTRVHSTARGTHYVYEDLLHGLQNGKDVWPHVDTRGVGGMVVGPGSWHPHGAYAVARDVPPAPVPPGVAERAGREAAAAVPSYTGPAYEDLTDDQRALADRLAEAELFDWQVRLGVAAGWAEGVKDDHRNAEHPEGRGWELLARDFAWWCSVREAAAWMPPEDGQALFDETLPEAMRANGKCRKVVNVLKAAEKVPPPPWVDPVFDATPVLRHVRQAAHSRGLPAEGVLLGCLTRALLCLPVGVTLPPTVGSRQALNLGTVVVGSSGATKSASDATAAELMACPRLREDDWVLPVGSGEGVVDSFYDWLPVGPNGGKDLVLLPESGRHRLFHVDEGETFRKLTERSGTTLGSFLRSALTGDLLGTTNSKAKGGHSRKVPRLSYRLCLHINLHPSQADILLGGESDDVGMPQRFLWAEPDGDALPDRAEDLPEWPGPLGWGLPRALLRFEHGDVDYPDAIKREIRQTRLDAAKGKIHPRAAHANLVRLKVALALALLHGEADVTGRWWALAGTLVERSLALQSRLLADLSERVQGEHDRREIRQSRAQDAAAEDRLRRAVVAVLRKVEAAAGEWVTWRDVKPGPTLREGWDTAEIAAEVGRQAGVEAEEYTGRNGEAAFRFRWAV